MLTGEQQFVLEILRAALQIKPEGLNAWNDVSIDSSEIARIITQNGILLTAYPVLDDFPSIQNSLHDQYLATVAQAIRQDFEGNRVLQELNNADIDCIALKGWEMRKLYPQITMRQMSDLDILVREYNYPAIKKLMERLGYESKPKSSRKHDKFLKSDTMVEMHKRLTDDSGEIQKWEKELWTRTLPSNEGKHILRMRDEDFYIFHILHMHRHFMHGGLGLRRVVDTWLFLHTHSDLNRAYLSTVFERTGLSLFVERMEKLAAVVIEENEMDTNSEILLESSFQNGIFGTSNSYKLRRTASMSSGGMKSGVFRSILCAVFLPYNQMKAHFPILQKWPIVLPWCWTLRILQQLGNMQQNIHKLDYRNLSETEFEEVKRILEAGGC